MLMKKLLTLITFCLMNTKNSHTDCLLVQDFSSKEILLQKGEECETAQSPASTLKVALSLIGFNEKLLTDRNNPKIEYKKEYGEIMGFNPMKI